jgi:hypothetical protein
MITNGDMETGDPPSDWTAANSAVLSRQPGGQSGNCLQLTNGAATGGTAYQDKAVTSGLWYLFSGYGKTGTMNPRFKLTSAAAEAGAVLYDSSGFSAASWTQKVATIRAISATICVVNRAGAGTLSAACQFDTLTLKPLTLSELLTSITESTPDVYCSADTTRAAGTQAGLLLCLDSDSSPANFIFVYEDGAGNIKCDKCVSGAWTNVATTAITYSAGAKLTARKIGTSVWYWYNNAYVNNVTISDAGIINNVKHGLFSTYNANTFDNYVCLDVTHYNLDKYL